MSFPTDTILSITNVLTENGTLRKQQRGDIIAADVSDQKRSALSISDNEEVADMVCLLQQLISKINSFGLQYGVLETKLKYESERSEQLQDKCFGLQREIDVLRNASCPKCPKLKKYIVSNKRKTKEAHSRLLSIAKILNVPNEGSVSLAQTLASQCFSPPPDSEKKGEKHSRHDEDEEVVNDKNDEVPFTDATNNISAVEVGTPVAYSLYSGDIVQMTTPTKSKNVDDVEMEAIERSPIIGRDLNHRSNISNNSSSGSGCSRQALKCYSPLKENKNLIFKGRYLSGSPRSRSRERSHQRQQNSNDDDNKTNNEGGNSKCHDSNDSAMDKKVWSMKRSRDILKSDKPKLKQMTLAVTVSAKEQDISKIPEYNGGVKSTSKVDDHLTIWPKNGDDCIQNDTVFTPEASSTVKELAVQQLLQNNVIANNNEGLKGTSIPVTSTNNNNNNNNNANTTTVTTVITPTNITTTSTSTSIAGRNEKLNTGDQSPPYKYRRDAVKKASERRKLPGQDCQNCYKFYQDRAQDMTNSQLKNYINKCSRHRDKYAIRVSTPPGFWNPRFNDTADE